MFSDLVAVATYNSNIKEISFLKRINIDYPLLSRDEIAKKLANVSKNLPEELLLQVDSAYRTRKTQEILWKSRGNILGTLIYNPQKGVPPHSTGGAIDVSLLDRYGKEINLSDPLEKYYQEPELLSDKITPEAQRLRLLLNDLMIKEGFAPNPREYWHFSYGDKMWAEYYKKEAIYGEIDLPSQFYYPVYKSIFLRILKRFWTLYSNTFKISKNY